MRDFANYHLEGYRALGRGWVTRIKDKKSNDAHSAFAEYEISVITTNVDGLHQKAGSKNAIAVYRRLPKEDDKIADAPVYTGT